jgi:hypothetical protein
MPLSRLREFLDSNNVKYMVISHSLAYTAQGVAALTHVSGKKIAKTVIVKIDGILAMAVVPASGHVDLDRLRILTGAETVEVRPSASSRTPSRTAKPERCLRSAISTTCRCMPTPAWQGTKRSPSPPGHTASSCG